MSTKKKTKHLGLVVGFLTWRTPPGIMWGSLSASGSLVPSGDRSQRCNNRSEADQSAGSV